MQGYYRILTPLSYGGNILRKGTVHYLRLKPESINTLLETKAIAALHTPPISEIPELADFAERLNTLGINSVSQFLEASDNDLKSIWRRSDHIESHKQKLIETYLMVEIKDKPCGC